MTGPIVVIGLGNRYRRDDGVGIVAADELDRLGLNGVRVVTDVVEPMSLLEAWSGAGLAVVIDGAASTPPAPGRVRRCALSDVAASDGLSSHGVDVVGTHALGEALGRVPRELVLLTVDVADTGHGAGLTPAVQRAVPAVVGMAVAEINRRRKGPSVG
ncbi:hydrogenase maturation protease [Mycobacterium interjectum]|uniref:hydrogenase maturation protease n=1 Tax=Mycobacterium interjectum TaxID=33895 RepID=UPI0021F3AEF2|nr:hydrogenase maturation protease [Mycobacterium interjectum]MCV7091186.1 hydrogenase maturation protease [Mycobacterium interjectum]